MFALMCSVIDVRCCHRAPNAVGVCMGGNAIPEISSACVREILALFLLSGRIGDHVIHHYLCKWFNHRYVLSC